MKRRDFVLLLAGAMTAARSLAAQQKAMPVVGYLGSGSPGPVASLVAAVRQGLSETGCVEGQNVSIEYRWAEGHYDRLAALAADLVSRKVDVIVAHGGTPSAAKNVNLDDPDCLHHRRRPGRDWSRSQSRPARRQPDGLQQHLHRSDAQAV